MLGNKLIKELDKWFKGKNKKELINFLISLIVILALLLFFYNTIFSSDESKKEDALLVNNKKNTVTNEQYTTNIESIVNNENRLKNILTQIDGVGKVDVMITYETSREVVPAIDLEENTQSREERNVDGSISYDKSKDSRQSIVTVNNTDLLVLKEIKPKVKGVIIVAEGAANRVIKNNIINAASAVFDIPVDKIVVFQRKH